MNTTRDGRRSWLLPLLALMRPAPGQFLGDERLHSLEVYLVAYRQARADLSIERMSPDDERVLADFGSWLASRDTELTDVSWPIYVQRVDGGPKNVRTFFRLFEEFLAASGRSLEQVEPWHLVGFE